MEISDFLASEKNVATSKFPGDRQLGGQHTRIGWGHTIERSGREPYSSPKNGFFNERRSRPVANHFDMNSFSRPWGVGKCERFRYNIGDNRRRGNDRLGWQFNCHPSNETP